MPQYHRMMHRPPPALASREHQITCLALGTICLATLLGGILCLVENSVEYSRAAAGRLLVPAGLMLLISGLIQARLIVAAWRNRRLELAGLPLLQFSFWRAVSSGAFVAYVAALAVGPREYVACLWVAVVSQWYAILLLPLAASPSMLETWRRWTQGRTARSSGWLVFATMLLLATRREDPDTLFFNRRLNIEGDTETGLHVKNLLDSLEYDVQSHFDAVLGPRLGRLAGEALRRSGAKSFLSGIRLA